MSSRTSLPAVRGLCFLSLITLMVCEFFRIFASINPIIINMNYRISTALFMAMSAMLGSNSITAQVTLSESEIGFPVDHYEYHPVTVTTTETTDIILPENSWIQTADVPQGTLPANSTFRFYVAPDGPTTTPRSEAIVFKGLTSGNNTSLTINQDPMTAANAYPAKWYYYKEEPTVSGWLDNGGARASLGKGRDTAVITAVGTHNRRLGHVLATTYKKSTGVSNLYTGDYILFSVPVESLPAGTDVDFMLTIAANDNTAPKYWVAEILDGDQWRKTTDQSALKQINGEDYSFYTKYFPAYQHATFTQSFTLENPVTNGMLQLRCRVVGDRNGNDDTLAPDNIGTVFLPSHEFTACSITAYPGIERKDTHKVGILGNSFTYFNGEPFMLKEIARSQGHDLNIHASIKGSQYFNTHVNLERSKAVIAEPGYDFVILQDQSEQHNKLADGKVGTIIPDTKAITAMFRETSPNARIILENTWCSPKNNWNTYGSPETHTRQLINGALEVAKADPNTDCVSPVGVAFETAYKAGIPGLWHTDQKHPGRNGSYLKACVHYLVMFGEPFNDRVPDCECDPVIAAQLRDIATRTVLGNEAAYSITR